MRRIAQVGLAALVSVAGCALQRRYAAALGKLRAFLVDRGTKAR